MKKVSIVSLVTIIMIVISSCGSSNNVVNNHGITKRKYNKGFFVQRNSNLRTANNEVKEERANADKMLAKQERVDAKRAQKESAKQKMNVEQTVAVENAATHSTVYAVEVEKTGSAQENERSSDDVSNSEPETRASTSRETIDRQSIADRYESHKKDSRGAAGGSSANLILLVILALIIPPLAVFLYEGATKRFWIDLILALVFYGVGFGLLGGIGGLLGLVAVIYALLIVLEVI
jgi:uncharacterized membrane protein YqaE (UPF0057 family)